MMNKERRAFGGLQDTIRRKVFEPNGQNCPKCGEPLYRHRKNSQAYGHDWCVMCFKCYWAPGESSTSREDENRQLSAKALMDEAMGYFKDHCVLSNANILTMSFNTFIPRDDVEKGTLALAKSASQAICSDRPVHVIFTGNTGTGKTHLAMSIVLDVIDKTRGGRSYTKPKGGIGKRPIKTSVASWAGLLDLGREAIRHDDSRERFDRVMKGMKDADLVMIDDLGIESSGNDYSRNLATKIFEAREDLATIVTTNLSGQDLEEKYGSRVMSRLNKNAGTIKTDGIRDHRESLRG